MYKTVRHGENSLQYKILAQQEEGITNVKCRKIKRGRVVGIVTIILLLICGIIASAVLVPLILTNDFITLTGTFQKFSVSTLRRSHSGNHVVVIAKKPHGWNSSRQSVLQSFVQMANSSTVHSPEKKKENSTRTEYDIKHEFTTVENVLKVSTEKQQASESQTNSLKNLNDNMKIFTAPVSTTNQPVSKTSQSTRPSTGLTENIPSTTNMPAWEENSQWSFESPSSFINWSKNRVLNHPLPITVGAFLIISFITALVIVLMKNIPKRKKLIEKETAEQKEDKTRLLKPSSRGSDEE